MKHINKVKQKSIKDYFKIKNINNSTIYLKNSDPIKLFKVEPINFNLKTDSEKICILENYKQFLKNYNFDVQIIIQTDLVDLTKHFENIDSFKERVPTLSDMASDYVEIIKKISNQKECVTRRFYIVVFSKNEEKFKSACLNLDNVINECSNDEIIKVLERYFKKYKLMRKELKWV